MSHVLQMQLSPSHTDINYLTAEIRRLQPSKTKKSYLKWQLGNMRQTVAERNINMCAYMTNIAIKLWQIICKLSITIHKHLSGWHNVIYWVSVFCAWVSISLSDKCRGERHIYYETLWRHTINMQVFLSRQTQMKVTMIDKRIDFQRVFTLWEKNYI